MSSSGGTRKCQREELHHQGSSTGYRFRGRSAFVKVRSASETDCCARATGFISVQQACAHAEAGTTRSTTRYPGLLRPPGAEAEPHQGLDDRCQLTLIVLNFNNGIYRTLPGFRRGSPERILYGRAASHAVTPSYW